MEAGYKAHVALELLDSLTQAHTTDTQAAAVATDHGRSDDRPSDSLHGEDIRLVECARRLKPRWRSELAARLYECATYDPEYQAQNEAATRSLWVAAGDQGVLGLFESFVAHMRCLAIGYARGCKRDHTSCKVPVLSEEDWKHIFGLGVDRDFTHLYNDARGVWARIMSSCSDGSNRPLYEIQKAPVAYVACVLLDAIDREDLYELTSACESRLLHYEKCRSATVSFSLFCDAADKLCTQLIATAGVVHPQRYSSFSFSLHTVGVQYAAKTLLGVDETLKLLLGRPWVCVEALSATAAMMQAQLALSVAHQVICSPSSD